MAIVNNSFINGWPRLVYSTGPIQFDLKQVATEWISTEMHSYFLFFVEDSSANKKIP